MIDTEALRKKVIDLAIQGKLTEQLPSDGDAETLYAQIQEEKAKLIIEGKIKKEKPLPEISEEDIPFEIPENWKWIYCRDAMRFINGRAYKKEELLSEGKYPVLRVGNFFTNEKMYYSDLELDEDKYCDNGDLLYAWSASFGPMIWSGDKVIYHYHIWKLDYFQPLYIRYLYYYLLSDTNRIKDLSHGIGFIFVTKEFMEKRLLPLPPIEEQKRIVVLLDKFFDYINIIDDLQAKYSNDLAVLKSKIIDAGIRGKLTEQLPEDGDAEDLYNQIQEEKAKLIKEGKIKKEKPLPEITEDEIPFEIPKNWKWVRISEVIDVRDGTHESPTYHKEGIPLITSKNLSSGTLDFTNVKYISKVDADKINERSSVDDGDILFAMIGTIGNPVIVKKQNVFCIKNVALFKRYHETDILPEYLLLYFLKEQEVFRKIVSGGLQPFISLKQFREHLMPLPPFEEQKRIVEKIDAVLELIS